MAAAAGATRSGALASEDDGSTGYQQREPEQEEGVHRVQGRNDGRIMAGKRQLRLEHRVEGQRDCQEDRAAASACHDRQRNEDDGRRAEPPPQPHVRFEVGHVEERRAGEQDLDHDPDQVGNRCRGEQQPPEVHGWVTRSAGLVRSRSIACLATAIATAKIARALTGWKAARIGYRSRREGRTI